LVFLRWRVTSIRNKFQRRLLQRRTALRKLALPPHYRVSSGDDTLVYGQSIQLIHTVLISDVLEEDKMEYEYSTEGYLTMIVTLLRARLPFLNKHCVICDELHLFGSVCQSYSILYSLTPLVKSVATVIWCSLTIEYDQTIRMYPWLVLLVVQQPGRCSRCCRRNSVIIWRRCALDSHCFCCSIEQ